MSSLSQVFDQAVALTYVNLADDRLGARVLSVSDEFFAPASRMLNATAAVFHPGRF